MRWKKQNQNQISGNWVKVSFRFLLDFPVMLLGIGLRGLDGTDAIIAWLSVFGVNSGLLEKRWAIVLLNYRLQRKWNHSWQSLLSCFSLNKSYKGLKIHFPSKAFKNFRNFSQTSTVRFCHLSCYIPREQPSNQLVRPLSTFSCPSPHPSAPAQLSSGKKHFASINFSEERTKIINEWIF